MQEKYKNRYKINSSRLPLWDYKWAKAYFVTICTKNRECFFGNVKNGKMYLSEIGKIAEQEWLKTPGLRPDMNLSIGAHVIMPNHFHAILEIGRNQYNQWGKDAMHGVSPPGDKYGAQQKNLSSVIRGFKSSVTTYARKHKIDFSWQTRFHESIIDDKKSYENVTNYINENPKNWENDSLF